MMIKVLLLACCVLVLFTSHVKGGCNCGLVCSLQCDFSGCQTVCGVQCTCSFGRKRDVLQQTSADDDSPQKGARMFKIPLPFKFSVYDKNKDGFITFEELKQTLPPVKNIEEIWKKLKIFDKDGNNKIDCSEFMKMSIDTDGKDLTC